MVKAEVPAVLADPKLAFNVLHVEQELIYMCAPVFVPQITGGALPPHVVTVKVSVSHLPILFAVPLAAAAVCDPLVIVVTVTGLFRAKVSKSSLS